MGPSVGISMLFEFGWEDELTFYPAVIGKLD
jgi:hypothetical protein